MLIYLTQSHTKVDVFCLCKMFISMCLKSVGNDKTNCIKLEQFPYYYSFKLEILFPFCFFVWFGLFLIPEIYSYCLKLEKFDYFIKFQSFKCLRFIFLHSLPPLSCLRGGGILFFSKSMSIIWILILLLSSSCMIILSDPFPSFLPSLSLNLLLPSMWQKANFYHCIYSGN